MAWRGIWVHGPANVPACGEGVASLPSVAYATHCACSSLPWPLPAPDASCGPARMHKLVKLLSSDGAEAYVPRCCSASYQRMHKASGPYLCLSCLCIRAHALGPSSILVLVPFSSPLSLSLSVRTSRPARSTCLQPPSPTAPPCTRAGSVLHSSSLSVDPTTTSRPTHAVPMRRSVSLLGCPRSLQDR